MSSEEDKNSEDSNNQKNLKSPSKLRYIFKENPEIFDSPKNVYGDDYFDGKLSDPNLSSKINPPRFDNKDNLTTKPKTNEIFNSNINSNFSEEDKNDLLGKKIKKGKRNVQKEEKNEKSNIVQKSQKSELKKNQDNFIKAVTKSPFSFLIVLTQTLENIKLNKINLRNLIGGVKKNKLVFKLNLYQMLCCDKDRKNKEILDKAQPKDELLYYYFLTRTYRFLFNHCYESNQDFVVNGENRTVSLFPTFEQVLEKRKKKYYNDYKEPLREKLIEEFKKVSKDVYNNFENFETKQSKKKFFTVITPKIEDLKNKYNRIFRLNNLLSLKKNTNLITNREPANLINGNNLLSLNQNSNLITNKEPANLINGNNLLPLNQNPNLITNKEPANLINGNNHFSSLDISSERNKFSFDKKIYMDNDFVRREEEDIINENKKFNEIELKWDDKNSYFNSNEENNNIQSFRDSDFFEKKELNDDNYIDRIHKWANMFE